MRFWYFTDKEKYGIITEEDRKCDLPPILG